MNRDFLEAELAVVSSRGQLVIPKDIRKRMKIAKGNVFAISSHGRTLVMKKMINPISNDDLNTLREVEEAWESIEKGEGITQTKDEFLKELKTWSEK